MSDATRPQTKPLFGHWCANTLVRILLRASLTTTVALLVVALNPFGFTRWTQLRSHDLWERIQAPAYDDTHGRDAVSIVYLDEASLRSASLARPLRLREHEMMLDDVVRPGQAGKAPEAVFVDFAFDQAADPARAQAALQPFSQDDLTACDRAPATPVAGTPGADRFRCYLIKVASFTHYAVWAANPSCSLNDLVRILCIRRNGGVPLIFVSSTPPASTAAAPPALAALGRVALVTSAQVSDSGDYWLVEPETKRERENLPFKLSPAAALYAAYCLDHKDRCAVPPNEGGNPSVAGWSADFERPLQVVWGLGRPDAFMQRQERRHSGVLEQRCRAGGGVFAAIVEAGRLLPAGFNHPEHAVGCAYSHATPYSDLDDPLITEADLDGILSGKLVLIGGQFDDSNDWISAPPQGQLPGIHLHAMALDNLVRYNSQYPKVLRPIIGAVTVADFEALLLSLVLSMLELGFKARMNSDRLNPVRHPPTAWFRRILVWGLGMVVPTAIGLLLLEPDRIRLERLDVSAHPGEGRDPDRMAPGRGQGTLQTSKPQRPMIWVPAFAGMSG